MHRTMRTVLYLCAATLIASLSARAQDLPKRTPQQLKALFEDHKRDFDYLLGEWEFTSMDREYGKGRGFWTAVRLAEGGQILDEYRVVGDKGETYYSSTTLRAYNALLDQWELISTDSARGLHDFGTAHKQGGEMRIEQKFGVMSPSPSLWRIRYYNIQSDRFSWAADRSTDDGKTWTKDYLTIEARRIGPVRTIGPFAPARSAK